jgi:hypothetical protein
MRRYLQFSIRSLFVLTTLAAVASLAALPAIERYHESQRQKELERAKTASSSSRFLGKIVIKVVGDADVRLTYPPATTLSNDLPAPDSP